MRTTFLVSLLLSCTAAVHAEDSCGMRAAKLFASGESQALAKLFPKDPGIVSELDAASAQLGPLKNLKEVSKPRFAAHRRLTVQPGPAPASLNYAGHWIDADSEKLGPVQLHLAADLGGACTLLALHVDFAAR
jgi:hypothetical protein